jgi:putative ABC transport system ATP-binding protein
LAVGTEPMCSETCDGGEMGDREKFDDILRGTFPETGTTMPFAFSVGPRQCVAVMGPSGSGKTTVLRRIADLDPHQGEVWLGETSQASIPAPEWRKDVTYVASEAGWWAPVVADHFNVDDGLKDLMAQVGVTPEKLQLQPYQLSSGERQRMGLIRALSLNPQFVLLDEPTSALDEDTSLKVEAMLRERMEQGLGTLLVTHDPEQADRLATETIIMGSKPR